MNAKRFESIIRSAQVFLSEISVALLICVLFVLSVRNAVASTSVFVGDPSFESVAVDSGSSQQQSAFWKFSSGSGVVKNGQLNDRNYNPIPDGTHCAFLSAGGEVSQPVSMIETGAYVLTIGLARTESNAKNIHIYLDETLVAVFDPNIGSNDWGKSFTDQSVVFKATAGVHNLKFVNSESGIVLVDNIRLAKSDVGIKEAIPTPGNYVKDFSFEDARVVGRGIRTESPKWVTNAEAGIVRNGDLNDRVYDPILDGTQCAFLRTGGVIMQRLSALPAGNFSLTVGLARTDSPARSLKVYVDDVLVTVWNPDTGSNDWGKAFSDQSVSIRLAGGNQSIRFENTDAGTILLDNVRLVRTDVPELDSLVNVSAVAASSKQAGYLGPENLVSAQGLVSDPAQPNSLLMMASASNFNSGYGAPNDETPLVHFDFGSIQSVKAIRVWNGNEPGYTWRGFRDVTLQYSNSAEVWTTVPARFVFEQAPGRDGYAGQFIRLPETIHARFIRIVCNSTWRSFGNSDIASLGRVQFIAGEVASPTKHDAGRWPAAAGVVNVKAAPYFALGDGVTDDTASIQRAITENEGRGRTVYLPSGTYIISASLKFSANTSNNRNDYFGRNTLRGEGVGKTSIRLKNAVFTNKEAPQPVLSTGYISFTNGNNEETTADWFNNNVSDLTIDTGSGNPGAKGLEFFSNNTGSVRNVRIVSGDGQGMLGLDLGHLDKNGPLLVKGLVVNGFNLGVRTAQTVNSQTFEDIELIGQTQTAFDNNGQSVSVKGLVTNGNVTAFNNRYGTAALIDAKLTGVGSAASASAIINGETLFARDIVSSGFARTIENNYGAAESVVGALSGDYVSNGRALQLFSGAAQSIRLTPPPTPNLSDADPKTWINVRDFRLTTEDNDAPAFQRAIDSGARDVFFPTDARIILKSAIIFRERVERLHGMQASIYAGAGVTLSVTDDLKVPVIVLKEFSVQSADDSLPLVNASSRTMVAVDSEISIRGAGTGTIFLENVVGRFEFGNHSTWARQLNSEPNGLKISNDAGRLWVLGLKTERAGTLVATKGGGVSEIVGGLAYTTTEGDEPMFTIDDSQLSATIGEIAYGIRPYSVLVRETRRGVSQSLLRGQAPIRFPFLGGSAIPLFVGSPQPLP